MVRGARMFVIHAILRYLYQHTQRMLLPAHLVASRWGSQESQQNFPQAVERKLSIQKHVYIVYLCMYLAWRVQYMSGVYTYIRSWAVHYTELNYGIYVCMYIFIGSEAPCINQVSHRVKDIIDNLQNLCVLVLLTAHFNCRCQVIDHLHCSVSSHVSLRKEECYLIPTYSVHIDRVIQVTWRRDLSACTYTRMYMYECRYISYKSSAQCNNFICMTSEYGLLCSIMRYSEMTSNPLSFHGMNVP